MSNMASTAGKKKAAKRLGWHFLPADLTLTNGDGRAVTVGTTLSIPPHQVPKTCSYGMHASVRPSDAAKYNRGPVLCRVEVWGDIANDDDKFCGRHRRVLWMKELTEADVREIARAVPNASGALTSRGRPFNVTYGLSAVAGLSTVAGVNEAAFDRAIVAWAAKHGAKVRSRAAAAAKPPLTEKALLGVLMPRVIRTKAEIMRDLGGFYDTSTADTYYDDAFEKLVDDLDGKLGEAENIDGRGTKGYFLIKRTRRR